MSNSDFETENLIKNELPGSVIKKNNNDFYTVFDDYFRIINVKEKKFVTPMLSKLTDFIDMGDMKVASFEIALPYCSKKIAPTNYLYGVIDDMGNIVGDVINFKTKMPYMVMPYNKSEVITSEGIKIHNFDNLITELSKIEEELYYETVIERDEYLKLHEQSNYKKN